ncbi:MAG: saccharopine dehydrogenase NADP-binding domain-containing protein [Ferruginibacter sp.]
MQPNQFLLYGANGYTGRLIAQLASTLDLHPVLAGRNRKAIQQLSEELLLPYRIIALEDRTGLQNALDDIKLVLHAAGPFQLTARPMIEACIATGTHYIDITGEIAVFEMAKGYNTAAVESGIMLMPGVGFDVVPTDCMALFLKNKLPDASLLQLAFTSVGGGISHGTAATMIMGLGEGGLSREDGLVTKKALGHKGRWIDFFTGTGTKKKLFAMTIPWGDISTAYFTTSIPNIETYTVISQKIYRLLKLQPLFNWLLRINFVRHYIRQKMNKRASGPSGEARANSSSLIWGKVENGSGRSVEATMEVPNGYSLTAQTSLLIAQKILAGHFQAGYQTPAVIYGEDLILEIAGTKRNPANEGRTS